MAKLQDQFLRKSMIIFLLKPILIAGGVAGDEIEDLVNKSKLEKIALSVDECENYLELCNDYKKIV